MKNKQSTMHSDSTGGNAFYVDLNDPQIQEKILYYLRNGIATTDRNGHQAKVNFRCTPVQVDILESIKQKAPKGYWKTQSDLLRSIVAIGCFVTLKYLNSFEGIVSLEKEFKLLDLINMIAKKARENDLHAEARKTIYNYNLSHSDHEFIDRTIEELQKVVNMNRKS